MTHNCPNCAAPLEEGQCRCQYCGTYFYDLVVDINNPSPIFLHVKTRDGIMTVKGIPRVGDFTLKTEDSIFDSGRIYATYREFLGAELNLSFDCCEFYDKETDKRMLTKIDRREIKDENTAQIIN